MFPNDLSPEEEQALKEPGEIEEVWAVVISMLVMLTVVPAFVWWLSS